MIKLAGAAVVLATATLAGFHQASLLARRPREIGDLIAALSRLQTDVGYGVTPLPDALRGAAGSAREPVSGLLRAVADELGRPDGRTAAECWEAVWTKGWALTSMKRNELDHLLALGPTLGVSDRSDQTRHLALTIHRLQADEREANEIRGRYEKMWRSLGVLSGALAVILLY